MEQASIAVASVGARRAGCATSAPPTTALWEWRHGWNTPNCCNPSYNKRWIFSWFATGAALNRIHAIWGSHSCCVVQIGVNNMHNRSKHMGDVQLKTRSCIFQFSINSIEFMCRLKFRTPDLQMYLTHIIISLVPMLRIWMRWFRKGVDRAIRNTEPMCTLW